MLQVPRGVLRVVIFRSHATFLHDMSRLAMLQNRGAVGRSKNDNIPPPPLGVAGKIASVNLRFMGREARDFF